MSFLLPKMTQAVTKNQNAIARVRLSLALNHLSGSTKFFTSVAIGSKYTNLYKSYAVDTSGKVVSYFHDIPLNLDTGARTANMVVEVPRWSNAKFEIDTKLPGNPIVQDAKKGEVRFVKNLFPYHGYMHNYGAFSQTWENPMEKSNIDDLLGDGDPLDVCEIGSEILSTGQVLKVKILGSLALVDDGELDWKVIVINVKDPLADLVSDIEDVEKFCPGLLKATRQWFQDYKLSDGKPKNVFALEGKYRNLKETVETVAECNREWKKLVSGKVRTDKFAIDNVSIKGTPKNVDEFPFNNEVLEGKPEADGHIPPEISRSYFF